MTVSVWRSVMAPLALLLVLAIPGARAATSAAGDASAAAANPIRKVVTMLQTMQKRVEEEGKKEEELYEKFQCYCKTSGGDLRESIASASTKVPAVAEDIKVGEGQLEQLKEDLKQHQVDRDAAKDAMAQATAVREKAAAAFASEKNLLDSNIAAIGAAVAALNRGMAGGFLQTRSAQVLRGLLASKQDILDTDRQELTAFLSGSEGYVPQGGEVVGILQQLGDEMKKSLADATADEEAAITSHEELMAAKKKEVVALTEAVEAKTGRAGDLAVEIVQMKNDLSDTEEALLEDQKFIADLEKSCATKKAEWEERVQTRSQELVAIAETIKILNDDDALDLFKKTLPGPSASFVQIRAGALKERRVRALAALKEARERYTPRRSDLDFIVLAIQGKQVGFEKVLKMIDGMVVTLEKEQKDDDHKKEYCGNQLDSADDKKKGLERSIADLDTMIADAQEALGTTKEDIATLEKGIAALDKSVAEATAQRKAEHEEFTELMASNSAAKELLAIAKNRLNKFYNPKLYKPPPKRELSREDRIAVNLGGTAPPTPPPGGIAGTGVTVFAQVSVHYQGNKVAPPPPPETFGAYATKSAESTGVIAMVDLLVKDLDKEMTEAETAEEQAQKDYEEMMKDSAEKRATDSKALTEKGSAKAALETDLESHNEAKASTGKELASALEYIQSLHSECDWLVKYYDVRKEARAGEADALKKAKAVLGGADYALVQRGTRNLRHRS